MESTTMDRRQIRMSEITSAVQARWAGELSPAQIVAEAQRQEAEAVKAEEAIVAEQIQRWEQKNPGRPRDQAPVVIFEQQARALAIETMLSQVWDGYRDPADGPDQATELQELQADERIRRATPAMSRWLTDRASEPSRETEQLVARVWPSEPMASIVTLEALVQARIEDELPVPQTSTDPLADQLLQESKAAAAAQDERIAAARAASGRSPLS